jgi:acetyl-CoA acetyltransferase family protein
MIVAAGGDSTVQQVFLYEALRTPRTKGRPDGSLATVPPWELVARLVEAMRQRGAAAALAHVERVALGCVTQCGVQGGHLGLLSRARAGLPATAVAVTSNNYCVSGLSAVAAAARTIATGEEQLSLAGGVESMSQVPFEADAAPMYRDAALAARFQYLAPPLVADWLASREGIGRDELDAVTVRSHARAAQAWDAGRYDSSVVPVDRPDGHSVTRDELLRPGLAAADLARFGAAFAALGAAGGEAWIRSADPRLQRFDYVHAVPHCPPVADGAALALLGTREAGARHGLRPRAELFAVAEVNTDPLDPFAAGFAALQRVLERAGLALDEVGAIEFMEAFAAVPALFARRFPAAAERANASGGHLALGHPMGASGAILLATLLAEMERGDVEWGVAVAHAVSGVGCAALLRRR